MRSKSSLVIVIVYMLAVANVAPADVFGTGVNQFTIDFVNISGDASSANGINIGENKTFSDPCNDYRIGTYEITNDQWNKFTNIYGTPIGNPSSAYDDSPYWTGTNVPTNSVSWYEAAQFVNYLNTSTGHQAAYKFTGTQGTSDYTFAVWEPSDVGYDSSNLYRNSNAYYFLPTDDEWVKAAYWNGTSLQEYANASPDDLVSGSPDPEKWNYDPSAVDEPWDVGSGSEELNGTFDMMGNVFEWMENPFSSFDNHLPGAYRCQRGGSYNYDVIKLRSSTRYFDDHPFHAGGNVGFRVVSVVPPVMPVNLDIKPQSCPNPLDVKSKGVLPIAILGTDSFDVTTIDPASIFLNGVPTIRSSLEDVATPVSDANECECSTEGPDGFIDLTLKFKTQMIVEAIGEVEHGDELVLELTGVLLDETPIEGSDCIIIRGKHKPLNRADFNGDGIVDMADFAAFAENWLQLSIVKD